MSRFPFQDSPINQIRTAPGGLVVHRFPLIGTDLVVCSVYRPIPRMLEHGYSTITTFDADKLPAEAHQLPGLKWGEMDGRRYAWFGQVQEAEVRDAAIASAFPGHREEQSIPGAGHQARVENWERCSREYREAAGEDVCPTCGLWRYQSRGRQCRDCQTFGVSRPVLATA